MMMVGVGQQEGARSCWKYKVRWFGRLVKFGRIFFVKRVCVIEQDYVWSKCGKCS